jgi:hypothetical protein
MCERKWVFLVVGREEEVFKRASLFLFFWLVVEKRRGRDGTSLARFSLRARWRLAFWRLWKELCWRSLPRVHFYASSGGSSAKL